MMSQVSRRQFVQTGTVAAAGAVSALASSRAAGANERIRLGFIGVANRGGQLLERTTPFEDAEVVALCDVYRPTIEEWAAKVPNKVTLYGDYREMLENEELDAVVIATPDHWHALQTIDACKAGLDVYVEKPLSITIHEGRRMVEVVRETGRIVQVGIHRRSCDTLAKVRDFVQAGKIGPVVVGRCCRVSNMWPDGIGNTPDSEPPEGLDWDMWLGPRPYRPFNPAIAPYKFRWHKDFSSQLANWGVHYFDAWRNVLDEGVPTSVCAMGGQYLLEDRRTIPDTMEVIYEFPSKRMVQFSQYETSSNPILRSGMVEFRGTIGTLYYRGKSFEVVPEYGGQFHDREKRMEPVQYEGEVGDPTAQHIRNFLDCVKSRKQPNCPIEEGHKSTTLALLGNISLEVGARLEWDPVNERITNHAKANDLLHYEYREPWKLG